MGKGALLSVVAVTVSTLLLLYNAQLGSNRTGESEAANQARIVAQDLASEGRKLVLAGWLETSGTGTTPAFTTLSKNGGQVDVVNFAVGSDTLDFTVRANYQNTVHEIRSRYAWNNFALNAMQFKVNELNPVIDPSAVLDFTSIGLDDQSLGELNEVLFTDLEWPGSLADYGLGMTGQASTLQSVLDGNGMDIDVSVIDAAQRALYDTQSGAFYPDQIAQAVDLFAATFPGAHTVAPNLDGLGASFGTTGGNAMLTIPGNLTVSNDFQGKGILVVEGSLIVPEGVTFAWDGIILVKPPAGVTNPVIQLEGNVVIEGNLVALQDGMPNTGHMDVSVMRDLTGTWSQPYGNEMVEYGWLREHTHDYTAAEGNYVVWHASDPGFPEHNAYTWFENTLGTLSNDDSVFVEVFNETSHGRGLVRFKLLGEAEHIHPIGSGFAPDYILAGNPLRTKLFRVGDLETFDITVTRLSALRKLWDTEDEDYVGCNHIEKDSGPGCVWSNFDRMGALTFRLYEKAFGFDIKLYEASLYWHRRTDEEEEFEEEMEEFADHLTDSDYGLTLTLGPDVVIREDPGAVFNLVDAVDLDFGDFGLSHVGTWTRSWDPDTPGNPVVGD